MSSRRHPAREPARPRTRMADLARRVRRHHRCIPRARLRLGRAAVPRGLAGGGGHADARTRAGPLLREATGASDDDDRLIGVPLDLVDPASIAAAAKAIEEAVGAPYALVHNAGISAAGMVEETDIGAVAEHVRDPRDGSGAADQGVVAVHAGGGSRPHRHGVQRRGACGACPRIAAVLGRQGCPGAVGRIDGGGDRTLWARGHRVGDGNVRHRHHHRRRHHRQSRPRRSVQRVAHHDQQARAPRHSHCQPAR